jgi:hypothetical protein
MTVSAIMKARARVLDPLLPIALLLALAPSADAALAYRRQITILGAQVGLVGTPHNDFPVLISITDPTLKLTVNGGHIAHASAYDIAFRDSGFALLDWEVEKYDGAAGTLIAWVRIASLPAGVGNDTILYLDYGDCTVTVPSNTPANVWNAYRYVYHMNQSGAADPVDSATGTLAVRNPTADAGIVNAYTTAGQIGGAIDLQAGPVVAPVDQFLPTTPPTFDRRRQPRPQRALHVGDLGPPPAPSPSSSGSRRRRATAGSVGRHRSEKPTGASSGNCPRGTSTAPPF